jgi:AsmA protein
MKIVKWLAIGVAVFIALLVVVVIAVPLIIPADTYKPRLITLLKDATGRDVSINGPISFSLFPHIGLEASNVAIGNPPGAATPTMAQFAKLQVEVPVVPLLHGDVEINRLVLVDPVIALEVDKQGRPNWQFAPAKPAATVPATAAPASTQPPAQGGTASLNGLRLDDVRLVNGRISYADDRSGAKQDVSEIAMKVSLPSLDGPFSADGSAVWRNEKMTLVASLANPRALLDGKSSAAAVKLQAKPVSFDFKGEAAGSNPAKVDGTVDLQVPSVRGLAAWAGTPLNLPGTGFGPLAISGKVAVAGAKIDFADANLSLDTIKAKGELALDATGARPAVKGRLDVDRLDVNPYLPPEGESKAAGEGGGGAPAAPAAKSSDWSDAPIDLSALKSADMEFALSAGGLQYRKIQVGKSALGLHLKDGRFEADLTELALYQGAGKGKVVLDGSSAVPGVETDFNLDKVQIEPLLKDAAAIDRVSGVGAVTFAVGGHGKSQRDIIAALDGKGNFDLANGAIKGTDFIGMAKNAAAVLQGGAASTQQQTQFTALTGSYTITNGVLQNNDLKLQSAEVPMTGAGTVDILHRTVDYKLTPKIGGAAVPILIKGPWDQLKYQPDLAGVVGDKLLQQGEKSLGGGKAPADVEGALKGLLGGKK